MAFALLLGGPSSLSWGGGRAKPQKSPFSVRVRRNVVRVPVVVRDKHGRAVGDLTKDDFTLFDNGKQQKISSFAVQNASAAASASGPVAIRTSRSSAALTAPKAMPPHFVALLFDDLDMKFEQVVRVRKAAERYLESSIARGARVGLFTTSGQDQVPFTTDLAKIKSDLSRIQPRGYIKLSRSACPPLTAYEAFLITQNDVNSPALTVATQEVMNCLCNGVAQACEDPKQYAIAAARSDWAAAENQINISILSLQQLVQRIAATPGQRTIVLISPGFISRSRLQTINQIIDQAVHAGVVVNSFNSRGLWVSIPGGDAEQASEQDWGLTGSLLGIKDSLLSNSQLESAGVLEALASGTGGTYFHDNNDFNQGFRETGGAPRVSYLLTFSPSDLRDNGKYHKLKVKLAQGVHRRGWIVQARKGYFAPNGKATPDEFASEEVNQALFSQANLEGLPIYVDTFRSELSPGESQLTVLTNLDISTIHFVLKDGRDVDTARFVAVVFDHDGNYVKGTSKKVDFNIDESGLEQLLATGLNMPIRFKASM
ncbi:MAG: VWA domain-containing protein [Acidobacteriota bacterium]